MVEIFEILTKDFPFVKKKYNKLCYCHNYTTICSTLIFFAYFRCPLHQRIIYRQKYAENINFVVKKQKTKADGLSYILFGGVCTIM